MALSISDALRKGRVRYRRWMLPRVPSVVSHPRSGTHLLAAYLAKNFFPNVDLSLEPTGKWGHWADRQEFTKPLPYGLIPSHHAFPSENQKRAGKPHIYIFRDGRAVAFSLWKSRHFMNPSWNGITFSDFLRRPIDWEGTPGRRAEPKETVAAHWVRHVLSWHNVDYEQLVIVRYRDLVRNPDSVLNAVSEALPFLVRGEALQEITAPVGIAPNKGKVDTWRDVFTQDDIEFFAQEVGEEGRRLLLNGSK